MLLGTCLWLERHLRNNKTFIDACQLRCKRIHNCAVRVRVRAHFKNIEEVITTIKAAIVKNKD